MFFPWKFYAILKYFDIKCTSLFLDRFIVILAFRDLCFTSLTFILSIPNLHSKLLLYWAIYSSSKALCFLPLFPLHILLFCWFSPPCQSSLSIFSGSDWCFRTQLKHTLSESFPDPTRLDSVPFLCFSLFS